LIWNGLNDFCRYKSKERIIKKLAILGGQAERACNNRILTQEISQIELEKYK